MAAIASSVSAKASSAVLISRRVLLPGDPTVYSAACHTE